MFLFWNYLNKPESDTLFPIYSRVNMRDVDPVLLMIVVLIAMVYAVLLVGLLL